VTLFVWPLSEDGDPPADRSMGKADLENAWRTWLASVTGTTVIIEWPRGPRPAKPYLTVRVGSGSVVGMDDHLSTDSLGMERILGQRQATLTIGAYGTGAIDLLMRIHRSVFRDSSRTSLVQDGISVQSILSVSNLTGMLDTEPEERGQMDLLFAFADDYDDNTSFIESASVGGIVI
jgi:hypothetical protein